MATATKANTQISDWTALAPDLVLESAVVDVSTSIKAGVNVVVVHTDTSANANGVLVRVDARFGAADENWHPLYELRMGAGTASTEVLDAEAASAQATIPVTLTATFETRGIRGFIHESGDLRR